jgi:hypothetical protein
LSLDLYDLLRNGSLKRNATTAGVVTWPHPRCGEQSIGYTATLGPERGDLWLRWSTRCLNGPAWPVEPAIRTACGMVVRSDALKL